MTRYCLEKQKLRRLVRERGFLSMNDFAKSAGVNRATLHNYFKGAGPFSESYYNLCEKLNVDPLEILSPAISKFSHEVSEVMTVVRRICEFDKSLALCLLGSRAKKTHKKYSDWDIGVTRGSVAVSGGEFLKIKQIADDASEDLPRSVDIVNLSSAPAWFLRAIDYEPIFLAGDRASWAFFMGVIHGAKKEERRV